MPEPEPSYTIDKDKIDLGKSAMAGRATSGLEAEKACEAMMAELLK